MAEPEDPAVRSLVDRAAAVYGRALESEVTSHPEPEALLDYQEGRLAGPQVEAIRHHLVACPQCANEMHRLDEFERAAVPVPAEESAAAAALSWAEFHRRVDLGTTTVQPETPARTRLPEVTRKAPVWALAASFAFAAFGVGLFVAAIWRNSTPAAAGSVASHPFVVDLLPDGTAVRRNMAGREAIAVPAGMDPIVLRLLLGDQTPYDQYSVEVSEPSGAGVWRQRDFRRQPAGEVAVLIPRGSLRTGDYILHVEGRAGSSSRRLASYSLRFVFEE